MTTLMLTAPQRDLVRDKGTKLGRFLIGLLFVGSALTMLFVQTPAGVSGYYETLGVPLAGIMVWLVIVMKIAAGVAIIIGKRVGLASAVLIGFVVIATLLAHRSLSDPNLLKNLAIIGGLLYLMSYGPGGSNTRLAE